MYRIYLAGPVLGIFSPHAAAQKHPSHPLNNRLFLKVLWSCFRALQQNHKIYIYATLCRLTWLDSEAHVRFSSGHGCPAIYEVWQSEKIWPSEEFPRWGNSSGAPRNKTRRPAGKRTIKFYILPEAEIIFLISLFTLCFKSSSRDIGRVKDQLSGLTVPGVLIRYL